MEMVSLNVTDASTMYNNAANERVLIERLTYKSSSCFNLDIENGMSPVNILNDKSLITKFNHNLSDEMCPFIEKNFELFR